MDRDRIMSEAHYLWYSIHSGSAKMYHDIKDVYWWNDIKKNIPKFVARCPSFQQVKVEHRKLGGLMQTIEIPAWKWEEINMDFITGLPRSHHLINQAVEKVKLIHERLSIAQNHQKSYSDVQRRDLEFKVDDLVFLKVSLMKGMMRFGKKGKLSPWYIGPYRIIQRVDQVTYELELPLELESIHPVFHVSMLWKCIGDPTRVAPTDNVHIMGDLSDEEVPVSIIYRHSLRESFMEKQERGRDDVGSGEEIKSKYPHLFQNEDMD
ncbi:uncharacterized protein [Nicotiana sylvestris]|uniref:uncharacterized protein n=1 Tax=Nicotiana sylvestris TaxID=4096 RepID=UPI00388CC8DB